MKPAATRTIHASDCRRVFSRLDPNCPRCRELAAGAEHRAGWSDRRQQIDAQHRDEIRRRDCQKAGCGPICTW